MTDNYAEERFLKDVYCPDSANTWERNKWERKKWEWNVQG
jgi:hypothetical protein